MSETADGAAAGGAGWAGALATLRRRADALRRDGDRWRPLRGGAGPEALARVRRAARPLLEALGEAYRDLLPPGYPALDDNGIAGAGGSIGLRLEPLARRLLRPRARQAEEGGAAESRPD